MIRLAVAAGVILGGGSCSRDAPPCPGTTPFDGATNVAPDGILEIHYDSLPRDLPSLEGLVTLTDGDGRIVASTVTVDADSGTVFVVPDAPLAEGEHHLAGIDWQTLPHWTEPLARSWRGTASSTFAVGGTPHLVGAGIHDEDTLLVGFSEEVDPSTVDGALDVGTPYTVDGPLDGDARLILVTVDDLDAVGQVATVAPVLTPDGRAVASGEATWVAWSDEGLVGLVRGRYPFGCGY